MARRTSPEPNRIMPSMKLWIWLAVALAACVMLLGGAFYFDGIKFFRDIERAETLLYVGWAVVAVIGVLVPVAVKAVTDEKKRDSR
jgi:hypothetical protein